MGMSKRSSKKNQQEETVPTAETDADLSEVEGREAAVEELDEALDALPDSDAPDSDDEAGENPLAQVDTSGETSFESAEFAAEDQASDEEAADEDEEDEDETEDLSEDDDEDESDDDEDEPDFVVHDADAE